ncbi:hypothetical protein [Burkholderia sp. Ac-20353]|uniref:hypothetical protein n=1 Tax=Burkholderia sp. Ac-20353 TaxID=2703894 RepID=UPI00197C43FD|nr:hypothetical protein [Burkholderia sp. Ac-20353]MBN3787355.1 hypothetical protein [Burkholderia sp. Ac-20353]
MHTTIHSLVASCLFMGCAIVGRAETPIWPSALDIKQTGDVPAACLPKDAGASIALQAAAVAEIASSWPPKEWAIEHIPGSPPFIVHPGECITYRQVLTGYRDIGGSKPLKVGNTYGFAFSQAGRGGQQTGSRFVGTFCVQQRPHGHRAFLPYVDHPNGTTTYPACGRYIGNPPAPDGIVPPDTPKP